MAVSPSNKSRMQWEGNPVLDEAVLVAFLATIYEQNPKFVVNYALLARHLALGWPQVTRSSVENRFRPLNNRARGLVRAQSQVSKSRRRKKQKADTSFIETSSAMPKDRQHLEISAQPIVQCLAHTSPRDKIQGSKSPSPLCSRLANTLTSGAAEVSAANQIAAAELRTANGDGRMSLPVHGNRSTPAPSSYECSQEFLAELANFE